MCTQTDENRAPATNRNIKGRLCLIIGTTAYGSWLEHACHALCCTSGVSSTFDECVEQRVAWPEVECTVAPARDLMDGHMLLNLQAWVDSPGSTDSGLQWNPLQRLFSTRQDSR